VVYLVGNSEAIRKALAVFEQDHSGPGLALEAQEFGRGDEEAG
jgi:hypothetical protein